MKSYGIYHDGLDTLINVCSNGNIVKSHHYLPAQGILFHISQGSLSERVEESGLQGSCSYK